MRNNTGQKALSFVEDNCKKKATKDYFLNELYTKHTQKV